MKETIISAPEGTKYLDKIFNINSEYGDTLPKNCLFNKVTTGSGGTYVALHSSEPTIIAVPTKALVKDKVMQDKYKHLKILGVSSDFPFKGIPEGCNKIICTYQALPIVAERLVKSNWNLVVDEMHLLTRMLSFSRKPLNWLLENFKSFKSYCFMSATVPRYDLLLDELKDLDRVTIQWSNLEKVSFECYHSDNLYETLLRICGEHLDGTRPGNAYFFYNSVDGICKLITTIKKIPEYKNQFSCMVSRSNYTKEKLRKVGVSIKDPSQYSKLNFVTSSSFEGVDFYDKEGVTYIVSDSKYDYTKYSIVTTIPQIVGRLRDSKYNKNITVLFNNHELVDSRTRDEFDSYIAYRLEQAGGLVDSYNELRVVPSREEASLGVLERSAKNMYVEIEDLDIELEEVDNVEVNKSMDIKVYHQAKLLDLELYELLRSNVYINSDEKLSENHISHSLSEVIGEAPVLNSHYSEMFKSRSHGLEKLCKVYEKDPLKCMEMDYEMYELIKTLGIDKIESCGFNKTNVRALARHVENSKETSTIFRIKSYFKVGEVYSNKDIKSKLQYFGLSKAKSTTLANYFEIKQWKTHKGENGFKLIKKL